MELVMLCQSLDSADGAIDRWLRSGGPEVHLSEKLDGQRCIWDGGVSVGRPVSSIPWANQTRPSEIATGYWSRLGNVIRAPYGDLGPYILDGELWAPLARQTLMSRIKGLAPSFTGVEYRIYDVIPPSHWYNSRVVRWQGRKHSINFAGWRVPFGRTPGFTAPLMSRLDCYTPRHAAVTLHKQELVPSGPGAAFVNDRLCDVVTRGGEGLVLKRGMYSCTRSPNCVKIKPFSDDEALLIGYTQGEGKYVGMIGAYHVLWKGIELQLSGMTDAERVTPPSVGTTIQFKYRGLSLAGVPQEARYWRIRTDD